MRVKFRTTCQATLEETWQVDVDPAQLVYSTLLDVISEALENGMCDHIDERSSDEQHRQIDERTIEATA